jgi:type IV secretory pathway VirB10-like protein
MRWLLIVFTFSGMALGQTASSPKTDNPGQSSNAGVTSVAPGAPSAVVDPNIVTIPAGTKIPLSLKQAISTKNAREGDAVYAETAFPFVLNDRILIPAGTYIQGKISRVQKPGRSIKRAELLVHFTSMIYPSGYTVMLPGSVENTPGADSNGVKDSEGTIQADKNTGKRIEDAAKGGGGHRRKHWRTRGRWVERGALRRPRGTGRRRRVGAAKAWSGCKA